MMNLYQIYIRESVPEHSTSSFLYEEMDLEVYDPLIKIEQYYLMNEYSKVNNKTLRIGVYAPEAAHVFISNGNVKKYLVESKIHLGMWYEASRGWYEEGFLERSESCFGMNACGEWKVSAVSDEGKTLNEKRVVVIPRTFSYAQYRTMQAEVKSLFEGLTAEPEEGSYLKELQIPLFRLEELVLILEEFKDWALVICKNPSEKLVKSKEKMTRSKISKWDSHSILEAAMFPFREKILIQTSIKELNLEEHQMIRYMIEAFVEQVKQSMVIENSALKQLEFELNKRYETLNVINGLMKVFIEKRCTSLERDINWLKERQKKWEHCDSMLRMILSENLYMVDPVMPELTHLFSQDPSYGAVYELYEKFENMVPKMDSEERAFLEAVMSSPRLYEIWILLQLIHHLKKIKIDCSGVRYSLVEKYKKDKKISGWFYRFPFDKTRGEFVLYYEKSIHLEDSKMIMPDYLFLYRHHKNTKWQGHVLDAKYKPYSELLSRQLEKDINHSGKRYLRKIQNTSIIMKSATLVHIDNNATNWNVDSNSLYHLSHFFALPGNLENIQTYIKRILHFFGLQKTICPSCGEKAHCEDKVYKQTYKCPNDYEVWVSNTCRYKREHQNINHNFALMKYAFGNYNNQVENNWDVHCPVCHKDYNGNVLKLDLYGCKQL